MPKGQFSSDSEQDGPGKPRASLAKNTFLKAIERPSLEKVIPQKAKAITPKIGNSSKVHLLKHGKINPDYIIAQ